MTRTVNTHRQSHAKPCISVTCA